MDMQCTYFRFRHHTYLLYSFSLSPLCSRSTPWLLHFLFCSYLLVYCSPPKGSSRTGTVSYSGLLPQILALYLIWKFSIKICNLWDVEWMTVMPKRRGSIPFYSRSKLHLWATCTLPATCTPPELTRQRQPEPWGGRRGARAQSMGEMWSILEYLYKYVDTLGSKVSGAPQYFCSKSLWENSEKWRSDGVDRDKNTEIEGRKALKRAEEGWRMPGGASATCPVLTLMWHIRRSLCTKSDQTLSSLRGGPWLSQEKT